jgi:hypothetical protein
MKAAIAILSVFLLATLGLIMCQQSETKPNTVAAAGTEPMKPKPMTTIQWLDSARNIGKIKEGEKVEIAFRFKNIGAEPLVVNNVVVSCGCTVAGKPEKPVMPGEEGVIKATFDSNGRAGTNHKTMAVYTNTQMGISTLAFDVEVEPKAQ